MSQEATVNISLQIRDTSGATAFDEQTRPTSFKADVSNPRGPTPGLLSVSTTGTNVDLSQLAAPGWCWMQNLEPAGGNYVEWGVHDGALFHPIGELGGGEIALFRLSRNLGEEEDVPGTGTSAVVNALYLRANTASCDVLVKAYDS